MDEWIYTYSFFGALGYLRLGRRPTDDKGPSWTRPGLIMHGKRGLLYHTGCPISVRCRVLGSYPQAYRMMVWNVNFGTLVSWDGSSGRWLLEWNGNGSLFTSWFEVSCHFSVLLNWCQRTSKVLNPSAPLSPLRCALPTKRMSAQLSKHRIFFRNDLEHQLFSCSWWICRKISSRRYVWFLDWQILVMARDVREYTI